MKIRKCEELKKAIDLYLLKCDKQGKEPLNEIRTGINTIEAAREQVLKELENKQQYISLLKTRLK